MQQIVTKDQIQLIFFNWFYLFLQMNSFQAESGKTFESSGKRK